MVKKKSKRYPYTQMTLKWLRKEGWTCDIAEHWNPFAKPFGKRKDLFGFIDIVAVKGADIVGVQSTSRAGRKSHMDKIMASDLAKVWRQAAGIWLITWKKNKSNRWEHTLDRPCP